MAARDDVKRLLAEGLKQREIAEKLGISAGRVSQLAKEIAAASPPPPKAKTKVVARKPPPGPNNGSFRPGDERAGAPPANKNAVTHGAHETIMWDTFTPQEQALWSGIDTDKAAKTDHELKLATIRARRMMERIANLAGVAFTVVEEAHEKGMSATGFVDKTSRKSRGTLGQILEIEAELTKVQNGIAKLIDTKIKIDAEHEPEDGDVDTFMKALNATAEDVWAAQEENDAEQDGAE